MTTTSPRRPRRLRPADLLAAIRAGGLPRWHAETVFYNLDNHRDDAQVARELHAIAATSPTEIALVECIGNRLPNLPGYDLIADDSRPGRANIAAYVRHRLPVHGIRWHDREETWSRTEGPGIHPPRSDLEYRLGRVQRLIAHQPPKGTDNTTAAQAEGIDVLAAAMRPHRPKRIARAVERLRPRLLTWDANRRSGEPGPGPDQLAKRVGGKVTLGDRIDQALGRRVRVHSAAVVDTFAGVRLRSDHGHAIRLRWSVLKVWARR